MRCSTPAVVLALAATAACGSVTVIELPEPYRLGWLHGITADGSALAVVLLQYADASYETFTWSASEWSRLPNIGLWNSFRSLSADGSIALVASTIPHHSLVHHRGGVATQIIANSAYQVAGGLTRDGNTVIGATRASIDAPQALFRWSSGVTTSLGPVPQRYIDAHHEIIIGERDDRFVFNSHIPAHPYGSGGPGRAVVYNQGSFTEIGTLSDATYIRTDARDMTADGTTIIGNETSWNSTDPGDDRTTRAWSLTGGVLSEITVQGVHDLHVRSITDDASVMVAYGEFGGTGPRSFLLYADGRVRLIEDILAEQGLALSSDQTARINSISGDGTVIAGVIGQWDGSVPNHALFTVTIPAPVAWPMLAGLLLTRRRR